MEGLSAPAPARKMHPLEQKTEKKATTTNEVHTAIAVTTAMSSSISVNSSRTTAQTVMAVVTLSTAAAASLYIFHSSRHQRKKRTTTRTTLHCGMSDWGNGVTNAEEDDDDDHESGGNYCNKRLGIPEEDLPTHIQREIYKERQRKAKMGMMSLKTPMYDNVYMLDEDREPMCTISMKKARWYIKKGIGEWSSFKEDDRHAAGIGNTSSASTNNLDDGKMGEEQDDVKCIRLLFEHNGSTNDSCGNKEGTSSEALYLRTAKQNICVACGRDGYIIRHYIVPYSYRSLLPPEYKSHMSHDIVILCPDCHLDCERHSKRRMKRIESELRKKKEIMSEGAGDVFGRNDIDPVVEDPYLGHVRSCAVALVKWKDTMPEDQVERYEKAVRDYLVSACMNDAEKATLLNGNGEAKLTKTQLEKACSVNYRVKNPNYVSGSDIVIRSLKGDARLISQFIVDWRNHFIDTVNPRHMPTGWRIDNPVVCGSQFLILDRGLEGPMLRSW